MKSAVRINLSLKQNFILFTVVTRKFIKKFTNVLTEEGCLMIYLIRYIVKICLWFLGACSLMRMSLRLFVTVWFAVGGLSTAVTSYHRRGGDLP